MSIIFGLHLLNKLYLISDTRVTGKSQSGLATVQDDLLKVITLNKRISSIAAGNVSLAKYVLMILRSKINDKTYYSDIQQLIKTDLEKIIITFVDETGLINRHSKVIIAGFNEKRGKLINSTKLGEAMSSSVKARGGGVITHQSVPHSIIEALLKNIKKGEELINEDITVNEIDSGMMIIDMNTSSDNNNRYTITPVDCFDYCIVTPKVGSLAVYVPPELISELEFRNKKGQSGEQILYQDSNLIMSFLGQLIKQKQFNTVGGHIFVTLVTPEGVIFPTGTLATAEDGKVKTIGKFIVKNDKMYYSFSDGRKGEYRHLEKFNEGASMEF